MLPATLLLAACSKEDEPAAPAPDRGKVLISHSAAAANTQITAFIADQQVGQLNYGQATAYLDVNAGTPTLRINNGSQAVASQAITVAKNQNYSVFAFSPTGTIGSAALLTVSDDLTAPATGTVKVRVVHLAVGAPSPVQLTVPNPVPGANGTDVSGDVAFGAASGFRTLTAGTINLTVTAAGATPAGPRTQVLAVGDGSGTGTGTKNYEAGKIYSIVLRGIAGGAVPAAQQPQAVILQHN
ncbi:hypothetical protein BEN47_03940 [Hymenobacter lapidarius]|uniref:DUF4397 domain-containing protein n=1 Tax=Hymenobacter lapidarius TaxID=1908237 RepID=A0A1G1SXU2_9BACT|nr:hypothetical protein BEN47_03940 [Hymenobacter lapidarius]